MLVARDLVILFVVVWPISGLMILDAIHLGRKTGSVSSLGKDASGINWPDSGYSFFASL